MEKKILVYDNSRGFSRFIDYCFSKSYSIDVCSKMSKIEDFEVEEYVAVFVVINDYKDLVDLLYITLRAKNVVVSTRLEDLDSRIRKIDEIVFLDLNEMKPVIKRNLKNSMKEFLLFEQENDY